MVINDFMPFVWGLILVVAIIVELKTSDIDILWFAVGAIVSLIIAIVFPSLSALWQVLIFTLSALVLLLTIGRVIKYSLRKKNIAKNSNNLIGKEITILEDCNEFEKGSGTIDNVIWATIAQAGNTFTKGDSAIIVAMDNNKLVVKAKEKR